MPVIVFTAFTLLTGGLFASEQNARVTFTLTVIVEVSNEPICGAMVILSKRNDNDKDSEVERAKTHGDGTAQFSGLSVDEIKVQVAANDQITIGTWLKLIPGENSITVDPEKRTFKHCVKNHGPKADCQTWMAKR